MKVANYLHGRRDTFSITQNFVQRFGAQYVSQGGLCQKPRGMVSVFDICNRHGSITNPVVNNSIHRYGDRVPCQYLKRESFFLQCNQTALKPNCLGGLVMVLWYNLLQAKKWEISNFNNPLLLYFSQIPETENAAVFCPAANNNTTTTTSTCVESI